MRAHSEKLLENTFFIDEVQQLKEGQFVTDEQYRKVILQTPTLKTHRNVLVRIGFFILGSMLYSSISGAVSLFALPIGVFDSNYLIMLYLYALIGLVGSEFLARQNFFAHGLDDAFVQGFLSTVVIAIGVSSESFTAASIATAVFGLLCCVRYVNALAGLFGLMGITAFFCSLVFEVKIIEQWALPFIGFILAIVFYIAHHFLDRMPKAYFYRHALQLMQVYSLVLGYASVNYFVVRELSVELMGVSVGPGQDIPFAMVFYVLTFAIPFALIFFGLKLQKRPLLLIGALALVCSILTIRYYYSVLPAEVALLIGGVLLFTLALIAIRKLKGKESGITFERDRNADGKLLLYAQLVASSMHTANQSAPEPQSEMPFGGGGFSGGGAGESY